MFHHFAYLDPGTGSLIVQCLIGVTAGIGVFGRRAISSVARKIKQPFAKTAIQQLEED